MRINAIKRTLLEPLGRGSIKQKNNLSDIVHQAYNRVLSYVFAWYHINTPVMSLLLWLFRKPKWNVLKRVVKFYALKDYLSKKHKTVFGQHQCLYVKGSKVNGKINDFDEINNIAKLASRLKNLFFCFRRAIKSFKNYAGRMF